MVSVLSSRVRELRLDKGWTQERLALVAGLSYRTIQRIEKDGHCSLDSKMALSAAFDITLNELTTEGVSLLNVMFDMTVVQDGLGIYKSIYTRTPELLCKPQEQIIGKSHEDILPAQLSERVSNSIKKLRNGIGLVEFGYQLQVATGKQYFNVKMVKADKDSFVSVISEISQQKSQEHKLLKNETLLNLVADTLKTGAWEMDLVSKDIVWTKQLYAIYELDYIPTIEEGIAFFAPKARPIIEQAIKDLIELGIPYNLQLPFITAKGKQLWLRVVGLPLFANAAVIKVSGTIQDITDLKIT